MRNLWTMLLTQSEQKNAKPTARVEGPSTAIYSGHLGEQYSKLATIKLELAEMQRDAFKEDLAIKQERENIEFELKKRSSELDIELKQIQLKKMLNYPRIIECKVDIIVVKLE
ncbi:hypothetical protein CBL_08425 [Carabus blaptoides fortunei]